jgi:hypothetical protein
MLFDNGLFWITIIILTVVAAILFGIYNRQDEVDKNSTLLVFGWIVLGIDLLIFVFGLFQAFEITKYLKKEKK